MIILLAAERHNALARRISSVTTWHRWTCVRERTDWSRQPSRTDSTCYRSFRLAARQPASWQVKSVMIVNVIPLNYFDCWQEIREPWRILSFFTRWWFASTTVSPSLWSSLIQRGAMKYCFRKPVVSLLLNFSTSPTMNTCHLCWVRCRFCIFSQLRDDFHFFQGQTYMREIKPIEAFSSFAGSSGRTIRKTRTRVSIWVGTCSTPLNWGPQIGSIPSYADSPSKRLFASTLAIRLNFRTNSSGKSLCWSKY